jgi:hypothetical protein
MEPEPQTTPATPAPPPSAPAADLQKVHDLVLKAHPDVVPDLVKGDSIDALIASAAPARAAYQRIVDTLHTANANPPAPAQPPTVPAGGAAPILDPDTLSPTTKIARALATRRAISH